jgi:hypothetical protein
MRWPAFIGQATDLRILAGKVAHDDLPAFV